MTLGLLLNNPFNLESNPVVWFGEVRPSSKPPFCQFNTLDNGLRAGIKNLYNQFHVHGLNTWREIVTKYAPPTENDTDAYLKAVCIETGVGPDDYINLSMPSFLAKSAKAFILQEQGYVPCPDNQIAAAVSTVLGINSGV